MFSVRPRSQSQSRTDTDAGTDSSRRAQGTRHGENLKPAPVHTHLWLISKLGLLNLSDTQSVPIPTCDVGNNVSLG